MRICYGSSHYVPWRPPTSDGATFVVYFTPDRPFFRARERVCAHAFCEYMNVISKYSHTNYLSQIDARFAFVSHWNAAYLTLPNTDRASDMDVRVTSRGREETEMLQGTEQKKGIRRTSPIFRPATLLVSFGVVLVRGVLDGV